MKNVIIDENGKIEAIQISAPFNVNPTLLKKHAIDLNKRIKSAAWNYSTFEIIETTQSIPDQDNQKSKTPPLLNP